MNSFEKLWLELLEKKPLLADPESKIETTSANLKSLLEQFYGQGRSAGVQSKTTSLFEEIFGK